MRNLAIHFTHPQSFIGFVDDEEKTCNVIKVDNVLLFKQKSLFAPRVASIIKSYTGSSKKFDKIVLSFNGELNAEEGTIVHNEDLDYITYTESYDGYSFRNHFSPFCKKSGEIILQDHYTTYEKSIELFAEISHPTLFLYDDFSIGIGTVQSNLSMLKNEIFELAKKELENPRKDSIDDYTINTNSEHGKYSDFGFLTSFFVDKMTKEYSRQSLDKNRKVSKSFLQLVSDKHYGYYKSIKYDGEKIIFNAATKSSTNLVKEYSNALKEIIDSYLERLAKDGVNVKTICIVSNQTSLLSEIVLLKNKNKLKLIIEPIDSPNHNFPMTGCGIFTENCKPKGIHKEYRHKAKKVNTEKDLFNPQEAIKALRSAKVNKSLEFEIIRIKHIGYQEKCLAEFYSYNDFYEHFLHSKKNPIEDSSYSIYFSETDKILLQIKNVSSLALSKIKEAFIGE